MNRQVGSNAKEALMKKQNVAIIVPVGSCLNVPPDQAGESTANANFLENLHPGIVACITGIQSMAIVTA
jgi:hypothetical protein